MAPGILGKKIGMTQFFDAAGRVEPVTVLQAGPCVVVQRKSAAKDGYEAIQVGLVDFVKDRRVNKPVKGHFAKVGVEPARFLREFRLDGAADSAYKAGRPDSGRGLQIKQRVDVIGKSKGKGFQGVVKRHGFAGGPATHGAMFHRAPGSIGQSSYPSRVLKGMRLPGQMGNKRVTAKGLEIVKVLPDDNVILVRGAVPGANGGYVTIRSAG